VRKSRAGTRAVRRFSTRTDTTGAPQRRQTKIERGRECRSQGNHCNNPSLLLAASSCCCCSCRTAATAPPRLVCFLSCLHCHQHSPNCSMASAENENERERHPTLQHLIEGLRADNFTLLKDEFGDEEPKEELFRGVTKDTGLSYEEFEFYYPDEPLHDRMNNVYVLLVRCFPSSLFSAPHCLASWRSSSNISFAIFLLLQFPRQPDCGFGPSRLGLSRETHGRRGGTPRFCSRGDRPPV